MQPAVRHFVVALAAALALGGCVTEPDDTIDPEGCLRDEECPTGQQCREGACYDRTTGAQFAAELWAPDTRTDMLPRAELTELVIGADNEANVMFVESFEYSGRVLLRVSDEQSVAARVIVSRPSRIAGAPDYVVFARAEGGKLAGQKGFSIRLPPARDGEVYKVTVLPDDGTISPPQPGQPLPNALAPPTTFDLVNFTKDRDVPVTLDSGGLKVITGQVVDAVGGGLKGMVVRAWNSASPSAPYQLVSSTAVTDDYGAYTLYVPLSRATRIDLKVTPAPGMFAPSLERKNVTVNATTSLNVAVGAIRYPALPGIAPYKVYADGPSAAGGVRQVIGARVRLSTVLAETPDRVIYEAEGTVGSGGYADVPLIPGVLDSNRAYVATIVPTANVEQGALWSAQVDVGPGAGGVLPLVHVPARASLTGKVVDQGGRGVAGVAVKPVLTAGFMTGATDRTRELVTLLQLPEVTTGASGTFTMYVDPTVGGQAARYDLELVPPSGSALPRWSRDDVAVGGANVDVGAVTLPAGTLISATVKTADGRDPVADAFVQVYMRDGDTLRTRGIATSDALGRISMVLPAAATAP